MYEIKRGSKNRSSRRIFCAVVVCLLLIGVSCSYLRKSAKSEKPSPPVEAKGPIISMVMASSIDAKGDAVNARFSFPQNEPQVTAIIYLGKINGSPLNVTWYKTSEDGDERLFEHQIQVKPNDRAFSVGKNGSGTLAAGTYKVVATLEGQTQEMEWDISPQKMSASSGRTFSVGQNADRPTATSTYQMIAMFDSGKTSQNGAATPAGSSDGQGQPPVAGSSGTHDWWFTTGVPGTSHYQPPKPPTAEELRICIGGIEGCGVQSVDFTADVVNVYVENPSDQIVYVLGSSAESSSSPIGTVPPATPEKSFLVDPCAFPGPDLPGSKLTFFAQSSSTSRGTTITLGNDTLAPRLKVVSTPARGTKVKAGDKINLKVTAQEKRRNGPWQTGVKVIQITAEPGGLVKDPWVNASNLPKPCAEKTWEQDDEATYTVPKNPPKIIRICALAEDYVGNQGVRCGEFPTGDVWKGTMHSDVPASFGFPAETYACSSAFDATLKLVVAGGEISGDGRAVYSSSTCRFEAVPRCDSILFKLQGRAFSDRLEINFVFGELVPSKCVNMGFGASYFRGQPLVVPITTPGVAEAQSTSTYVPDAATRYTTNDTIHLKCETCAP